MAAFAWSASDSSTSGQTTKHCRPARDLLADALVGARARARPRRPRGSRPAAGRSAARAAPSRRGRRRRSARACAGSAWRSCAARAARGRRAPCASSAARWRTPKRCCSSTTTTARSRNSTGCSISACVPTTSCELARREPGEDLAPPRGAWSSRSAARPAAGPPSSESSVREVLLGERLGGRHQRRLARRSRRRAASRPAQRTVLPDADLAHQQALHRPLAGEVRVDLARSPLLVAGQLERQRPAPAVDHHAARLERPRAPPSRRARLRPATASWSRNSSSKASRRRAPCSSSSLSGKCAAASAAGRSGSALRDAQPGGQRLDRVEHRARGLATTSSRSLRGADALGGRVDRHEADRVDRRLAVARASSYSVTQNWLRWRSLPCSSTCVPSPSWRASQGWLNQTATSGPLSSNDPRLDALAAPVAHRPDLVTPRPPPRPSPPRPPPARAIAARRAGRGARAGSARSGRPQVSMPSARGVLRASGTRPAAELGSGAERIGAPALRAVWAAKRDASMTRSGCHRGRRRVHDTWRGSLRAEQPPPGGLAALVVLQLDAVGQRAPRPRPRSSGGSLAGDAGDQLGAVGELRRASRASVARGSPQATSSPPA